MQIIEVSQKEYSSIFFKPFHVFNSVQFNKLNEDKCDEIKCLIFKDNKIRLGIIFGKKEGAFVSPFSAPFGGFSFLDKNIQIKNIDELIKSFELYCINSNINNIKITLSPSIYSPSFINKIISSLFRNNYKISHIDLNHFFRTINFDDKYIDNTLSSSTRNKLNLSFKNNFHFKKVESELELEIAYKVIQTNRIQRGFPLKMSYEDILKTIRLVKHESFLLFLEKKPVASAIVFYTSEKIVQIIYWGDLLEYSNKKTMNFLSYKVFEHFKNKGIEIVDIGPSSENGVPNYGLSEFKESMGCEVELKYSFKKKLL